MLLERNFQNIISQKAWLAKVAGLDIKFQDISIDIDLAELAVWLLEVIFVFLVIVATKQYILGEEVRKPELLIRILITAILIVLILPIFGVLGQNLTVDDRTFYALAVVIVYTITIFLIRYLPQDYNFNSNVILTTIVLLVLYFVRVVFDIAII